MAQPAFRTMGVLGTALGFGLVVAFGASQPGCFFPDFTFEESTGGSGGTATTSTSNSAGGTTSSSAVEICNNGIDDDGDNLIDCADTADCASQCVEDCKNGVDDDGDNLVDCLDTADCASQCVEDCGNSIDDDQDGKIDCADEDCASQCVEICDNGKDDDGDDLVDCMDTADCAAACVENCTNGKDDDQDGKIDCNDEDCASECVEICNNGMDDDGDDLVDCLDPDCVVECTENCTNGVDDDGDMLVDCNDVEDCSSSPACVENCTNGTDDDGDMLVDCKDLDSCQNYACASSVPAGGWSGYFAVYVGSVASDPFCTADYPTETYVGNANIVAPPAMCTSCTCGMPQMEVCDPPDLITALDVPCGGTPSNPGALNMPAGWGAACTTAQGPSGGYYFQGGFNICGADGMQPCNQALTAEAPTVTGGFCGTSGGQSTVTPATWGSFVRVCGGVALTGKGCNINQTCLPKPAAPFHTGTCIMKSGDVTCPLGSLFSQKVVVAFDNFTDTRGCSSCGCGQPAGSTCAGNITVHADSVLNQCLSPVTSFAAGTCKDIVGNPAVGNSKFTTTTPPTGGACQPSGGLPTGQATPTFPRTLCCIP